MLEQISDLVKYYGQDTVVNNPAIPAENNNAVMAEATNTITSGMQNMLAGWRFTGHRFHVHKRRRIC
ncbi:MAG: hypothetical protein WDO16_20150 [Bacteroidota bacterium]